MTTLTANNVVGAREDLANVIAQIQPADVPIYSAAKKETSSGVFHEWLYQDLAAAADNKLADGGSLSSAAVTAPVRIGNYHMIASKVVAISGTSESINAAGRDSEIAYQKLLKAKELRRDMELAYITDNAYVSSGTRECASITSYLSNVSFSTAGSTSALAANNQNGSAAITTTGTDRSLTIAMIDAVMQDCYIDGGEPNMMVMSPALKNAFSGISNAMASGTSNQVQATEGKALTLNGSVSIYMSDFGALDVTPSRVMAANHNDRVFLLDTDYLAVATLPGRNFVTEELAKTSDAETFAMITEHTIKLMAPKAHGAVIDIDGTVT